MKTRLTKLKLIAILGGALLTTAAFAQSTYIWTNSASGDLATAANWSPNGVPSPNDGSGDTMEFNGQSTGAVFATSNTGGQTGYSGGNYGLIIYLTASQTSPVDVYTTVASGTASAGIRMQGITMDPGAAAFGLGNTSTTNALYVLVGGNYGAQTIELLNNSANPATIYPNVKTGIGGGNTHTYTFDGTGNWIVNNYLQSANGTAMAVTMQGSGTMFWTATNVPASVGSGGIASPLTISSGTIVLESSGLLANQNIVDTGLLEYNAVSQSQTLGGLISSSGNLQVNNGTLTLKGGNSYTGNTILSGGELIVSAAENPGSSGPLGVGGTIAFSGGTLGYTINNTYDYSARFSQAAGQAYSIDSGGQNVTLATALTSSGGTLTKLGSGTLTLTGANTYGGATTISAGKLVIQGSAGSGNITVANSTALGATAGSQLTPGTLTVGTTASATLEFNAVSSTSSPLIAAGTVSAGGTITINVNSGSFAIGHSYPLLSWAGGSAPAVTLGTLTGANGNLSTNGNVIQLNVTAPAYVWTGLGDGDWDLTSPNNWKVNGTSTLFANGDTALFDDTATGTTNVVVNADVLPAGATVNNNTLAYNITSSGADLIGGTTGLSKNGNSSLTLSGGVNTYSGATTINGGLVSVSTLAPGGSPSDIGAAANAAANLVLNGGTLQYTGGGATSDHLFTLGTAGGTIDDEGGQLTLSNPGLIALNGTGARTLVLTGSDTSGDTLAAVLGDNGGQTALTKTGAGTWIVTGNNTNSGTVTISGGILQVGNGAAGALGSGNIIDDATLEFDTVGAVTNGPVSGTGAVINDGTGTVILAGNNSYQGATTINSGAVQLGNGGATGAIYTQDAVTDNGTLIFNSTSPITIRGYGSAITGTGNVIDHGSGLVLAVGGDTFTGWLRIDPGATLQPCIGAEGTLVCSVITNNGTILMESQDDPAIFGITNEIVGSGRVVQDNNNQDAGWVVLAGTNDTYTGGTFIGGGGLVLGDGLTPGAGAITGSVWFTNTASAYQLLRSLIFNRADNFTFTNNIISVVNDGSSVADSGAVVESGPGTVALTGNNNYPGGTTINAGTVLQVGAGGASGSIGTGAVTDNGELDFNLSSAYAFTNVISGAGTIVQLGSGTTTLSGTNTYTGSTTVSNGTLVLAGPVYVGGDLDVDGGTLVSGGVGLLVTNTVAGSLNLNAGTVAVTLNKSVSQSNTLFMVSGGINIAGGTLSLANVGPALAVGDTFTLFSQPVSSLAGLTVTGGGATWNVNNLTVNGSITVSTLVVVTPPKLNFVQSGNNLQFSWTGSYHLQVQTNSLATGLSNNWVNYTGGGTSPVTVPVNPATKGAVFFRLSQ